MVPVTQVPDVPLRGGSVISRTSALREGLRRLTLRTKILLAVDVAPADPLRHVNAAVDMVSHVKALPRRRGVTAHHNPRRAGSAPSTAASFASLTTRTAPSCQISCALLVDGLGGDHEPQVDRCD